MIEAILAGLATVAVGFLLLLAVIALPLLLIGLLFKALLFLILLPFRIVGWVFGALFAVVGALLKVGLFFAAAIAGLFLLGGAVILLPLTPILLIIGFVWLLARLFRPRPAPIYHQAG